MLRNLATSLILTERDEDFYEGLVQADGKTEVQAPKRKGRVTTTVQKAKEVRSLVERCVTIAKRAQAHEQAAAEFATDAERNTEAWKAWRTSDQWQKWNAAMAPAVAARRRVFSILRSKEAVALLFDEIAPRFMDRPGGYTRVLKMATPRLGDAGAQAVLEFVGQNDRVAVKSEAPAFDTDEDENEVTSTPTENDQEEVVSDESMETVAEGEAAAGEEDESKKD